MRVTIVSSASSDSVGGLSSYMRLLETNLRERSVHVSTAARFVSTNPPSFVDYAAVEAADSLSSKMFPAAVFRPNPAFITILGKLNHLVNRPVLRDVAKRVYVAAYREGLRKSLPVEIDHLHYVGTGQELLGFAVLAEARRRKAGFTIWPAVHPGKWGDGPLDIDLYNCADTIFCQSRFELEHLRSKGVEEVRLLTTGLGPATNVIGNADRFRAKHDLNQRPLILFIGRKDRGKGYHALCSSMSTVCGVIPGVCLVAVGPSREPPYPEVPSTAFLDLGSASEIDKADALAACDVFCMPSDAEAFGIVYVEAWANHKPVVGGVAPAVRELITEGVNGLCASQNPEEIAAALIRLLSDEQLRVRMGENGFALQQETYNWKAVTDKHIAVFNRAIERNRR